MLSRAVEALRHRVGWLAVAGFGVALIAVSPLGEAGADRSLAMHMVQHVVLVSLAAPLVAAGAGWPRALVLKHDGTRRRLWLLAWPAAWAAMWFWHIPAIYGAALDLAPLHAMEHGVLFITWTLGWASVMRSETAPRPVETSFAVGLLGITALQSTVLGALLAFSGRPWYSHYAGLADPLLDQRMGGTVMAVAMGPTQLLVTVWLVVQWLREAEAAELELEERLVLGRVA